MNYKQYVSKLDYRGIKRELKGLNDAIERFGCFNPRDLMLREYLEQRLNSFKKRGF